MFGRKALVWLAVFALTIGPAGEAGARVERPDVRPLIWQTNVGDPAVAQYAGGYLVTGTGTVMPRLRAKGARGPFTELPPSLTTFPSWVLPGDQWAPALFRTDTGWLLFYSAVVAGLAPRARCIGVAVGATATGLFLPVSDTPLVCPPRAGGIPAEDQLLDRSIDLPISGVIDPSVFRDRNGKLFLLYKTQGVPSTIRLLPLTPDGQHAASTSREILRADWTVENPVMVRQGRHYVLFTSEGDYQGCAYRTTWRRSKKRYRWRPESTMLLGPGHTGVCGPGGADVVQPKYNRTRLFFHGWVCYQSAQACPRDFHRSKDRHLFPSRAMYGVVLDWNERDEPVVHANLDPR